MSLVWRRDGATTLTSCTLLCDACRHGYGLSAKYLPPAPLLTRVVVPCAGGKGGCVRETPGAIKMVTGLPSFPAADSQLTAFELRSLVVADIDDDEPAGRWRRDLDVDVGLGEQR
jgi:hypothetical protein